MSGSHASDPTNELAGARVVTATICVSITDKGIGIEFYAVLGTIVHVRELLG